MLDQRPLQRLLCARYTDPSVSPCVTDLSGLFVSNYECKLWLEPSSTYFVGQMCGNVLFYGVIGQHWPEASVCDA